MSDYRPEWASQEMEATNNSPYVRHLGIRITEVAEGYARVVLPTNAPHFVNRYGNVHGGGICSLIDVAAAMALRSTTLPGQGTATVDLTVNFMGKAKGSEIVAEGRLLRRGANIAFVDVAAKNADGSVVAKGGVTFMVFRMEKGARTG